MNIFRNLPQLWRNEIKRLLKRWLPIPMVLAIRAIENTIEATVS